MPVATDALGALIERWKSDPGSTYRNWFLWDDRLKNFRSIRRGLAAVVREIDAGAFGNVYRGSSLEVVVGSIAEQRQIFKGADHAFLWKPKLRIPDIYENADNQRAVARLLHACECCDTADAVIEAIHRIDAVGIKGLGPAVANLLYFIQPHARRTLQHCHRERLQRPHRLVYQARALGPLPGVARRRAADERAAPGTAVERPGRNGRADVRHRQRPLYGAAARGRPRRAGSLGGRPAACATGDT